MRAIIFNLCKHIATDMQNNYSCSIFPYVISQFRIVVVLFIVLFL